MNDFDIKIADETFAAREKIIEETAKILGVTVERIISELESVARQLSEKFHSVADALKEFSKLIAETNGIYENEERKRFTPYKSIGKPSVFYYGSKKLWRKNRALFRPYKCQAKQN